MKDKKKMHEQKTQSRLTIEDITYWLGTKGVMLTFGCTT